MRGDTEPLGLDSGTELDVWLGWMLLCQLLGLLTHCFCPLGVCSSPIILLVQYLVPRKRDSSEDERK